MDDIVGSLRKVRFTGDRPSATAEDVARPATVLLKHFVQGELLITESVAPELWGALQRVVVRLGLSPRAVEAFVYASPFVEAQCVGSSTAGCVVRFSSALVDLLTTNEFEFVVGHELGHFIFHHHDTAGEGNRENVERLILQRAREISVDRIGLLACKSLSSALGAMMKIASGLSERHIRLDMTTFLAQVQHAEASTALAYSTHPSILVRCRALLWFSMNEGFSRGLEFIDSPHLARIDQEISRELHRYVDKPASELIQAVREEVMLWSAAAAVVASGSFTKAKQERFGELFGAPLLEKVKTFLAETARTDLEYLVSQKLSDARNKFSVIAPEAFVREAATITETAASISAAQTIAASQESRPNTKSGSGPQS